MRILFVHHYFPGQFDRIVRHYRDLGHDIVAFHRGLEDGRSPQPIEGVRLLNYGQEVVVDRPKDHVLCGTDEYVREAASMAIRASELKESGWYPDLVYSHTGWGTGAFVQDVFPDARYVKYCEWFYNNSTDSMEFLNPGRPFGTRVMTSLLNIPILSDLMRADLLIAPTEWQRSQFPPHMRDSIEIAPDGVDTKLFAPDPHASFSLSSGRDFRAGDRVVTYVARGADPFRGFRPFLEALAILQQQDARVEAIIVGDRSVYYGRGQGTERHFDEVVATTGFDPERTHFVGRLDYADYRRVLQVSAAHVYLTVPFVLSWSALESLSAGCMFVGSNTAPVREFVTHGENGLLADFFDPEAIAAAMTRGLEGGPEVESMRRKARDTIISRWSAEIAIARHEALVARLFG